MSDSGGPDIAVAPRPSWLLIGMVIASTAALLATTDDHPLTGYPFETTATGKPAQLSASAPSQKFSIKVTVNALGPNNGDTTARVRLTVHGTVVPNPAPSDSVFVEAQLSGRAGAGAPPLSVLTDFEFGQDLPFFGDCARPSPVGDHKCTGQATLELKRDDAGVHGGVLDVNWTATFDGTASTTAKVDMPPTEPPPWTIEVTPL